MTTTTSHFITSRTDGPDLADLVGVIRYLRDHGVAVYIGQRDDSSAMTVSWTPLPLPGGNNDRKPVGLTEGFPHHKGGHTIGPDGTLYDANGEAL